ncbi:MAG: mechanosensitive ion channel family protein [Geminicoccaceae bacterium]
MLLLVLVMGGPIGALADDATTSLADPLAPPDLSSPRATLDTFIAETKSAVRSYYDGDLGGMRAHAERAFATFEPVSAGGEASFVEMADKSLMLLEVLARVTLPPPADIPDAAAVAESGLRAWTIPGTELRLASQPDETSDLTGFLFTEETVLRIPEFYRLIQNLPASGELESYAGIVERFRRGPGVAAPAVVTSLVQSLPRQWFTLVGELAIWKWIALATTLLLAITTYILGFRLTERLQRRSTAKGHRIRWAGAERSVLALALVVVVHFLAVDMIAITGLPATVVGVLLTIFGHLAVAWLIFQLLRIAADFVISARELSVASLDTQLVRLVFHLASVLLGLYVLVHMADQLGVPVTPMLAGLGVGGLAVALAVRPTLENVVAGFVLFADKPVKVGEFCQFGDKMGTVEAVGLRSVRVRGIDRTLISVPNAEFCQMQIVNFTRRDSILLKSLIGLRYETSADQLRLVLVRLRELLIRHPKVAIEPARVRFVGYGAFSLDLEIFAYVTTRDFGEFLAIQEDINLRIKDIVESIGAGFAFPSQTLYLERSAGADPRQAEAAGQTVERWRKEKRLPFPDHEEQFRYELADTLDYPPRGSPAADAAVPAPAGSALTGR